MAGEAGQGRSVTLHDAPRVVFDCGIILQAAVSHRGPSHAAYRMFEHGAVELFVSQEVLSEIGDVLTRPELTARFPSLNADRSNELIDQLHNQAVFLAEVPRLLRHPRDPKDEPYLNLALAAGARFLVTWDRDLLDLMEQSQPQARAFRLAHPHLQIVTPAEFLRAVEPIPGEQPSRE